MCHVISQVPAKQQEATLSALLGMSLIFYFITNVKSDLVDPQRLHKVALTHGDNFHIQQL